MSGLTWPRRRRVPLAQGATIVITIDGAEVHGRAGQTIAAVLLASGRVAWQPAAPRRHPRGVYCGIGVCYDCLLTVNGIRDVRACQRAACDGDVVSAQADSLPPDGREGCP